jgi:hypothetical protein
MPRDPDVPFLCESADGYWARPRALRPLLPRAHGEGNPTESRHLRTSRPADPVTACRNSAPSVQQQWCDPSPNMLLVLKAREIIGAGLYQP